MAQFLRVDAQRRLALPEASAPAMLALVVVAGARGRGGVPGLYLDFMGRPLASHGAWPGLGRSFGHVRDLGLSKKKPPVTASFNYTVGTVRRDLDTDFHDWDWA